MMIVVFTVCAFWGGFILGTIEKSETKKQERIEKLCKPYRTQANDKYVKCIKYYTNRENRNE